MPAIVALTLALLCLMTNIEWNAYAQPQQSSQAVVHRDSIWVDTVKHGNMPVLVRALGTITTAGTADLKVARSQAEMVQSGQPATVELRRGITIAGKVARVDSSSSGDTVTVVVDLQAPVPEFRGETVDGIIQIRTLANVIPMGRPAGTSTGERTLFKLEPGGSQAARVQVRFGVPSANRVQVVSGLQPGDRVILSDVSKYDGIDRLGLQ